MSDSLSLAFFLKNHSQKIYAKRYNWGYNRQYLPRH